MAKWLSQSWADAVHEWRTAPSAFARVPIAIAWIAAVARLVLHAILQFTPTGGSPMRNLTQDVRFAARRLRHAAGFSLFAIATLGLGIGGVTAVYSVVHAVVVRTPDIPDIDRIFRLHHSPGANGGSSYTLAFSWPDIEDLKTQQTSFSHVAAWTRFSHALVGPTGPHPLHGELVDGDYFDLLRVQPALGRLIQAADDDPAQPPVVVLSDQLWRSAFAADPAIVGQPVFLGGHVFQVVGVAPSWFRGLDSPTLLTAEAWVPIRQRFLLERDGFLQFRDAADRDNRWVRAIGRLRPGRSAGEASAELMQIGQRLDASVPLGQTLEPHERRGAGGERRWSALPFSDIRVNESMHGLVAPVVTAVLVSVGLVLLVVCTNLANLLLARGASRSQEMAVRLALGAARLRLVRELVVESAMLAVAGGAAGVLLGRAFMVLLSGQFQLGDDIPQTIVVSPELNPEVLLLSCGATLVALLVFGLVPAWHSTRGDIRSVLTSDATGGVLPRWRGRRVLIAGQVAVSSILLGLTAVSAQHVSFAAGSDPGFALDQLSTVAVDASLTGMGEARARQALDDAVRTARLTGGVEAVTVASRLPAGSGGNVFMSTPDRPLAQERDFENRSMLPVIAGSDFFDAVGVPILEGRPFDERDSAASPPAIILSAIAARNLFGSADAVGRAVDFKVQAAREMPILHAVVVGIVGDTAARGLGGPRGVAYLPFGQHYEPQMMLVARSSAPVVTGDALRQAVQHADPQLTITRVATGAGMSGEDVAPFRFIANVAGSLGVFSLLLSLVGLYGVLSFVVARRTRELGVRIALGADAADVRRLVLRDGLTPVAWGLAVGTVLLVPALMNQVFLRVVEPSTFLAAALAPVLMLAAAAAAAWWPARRASRTDPNVALRNH